MAAAASAPFDARRVWKLGSVLPTAAATVSTVIASSPFLSNLAADFLGDGLFTQPKLFLFRAEGSHRAYRVGEDTRW